MYIVEAEGDSISQRVRNKTSHRIQYRPPRSNTSHARQSLIDRRHSRARSLPKYTPRYVSIKLVSPWRASSRNNTYVGLRNRLGGGG